ncbi:unnamed protein product [Musa acuminata var. zebrina]
MHQCWPHTDHSKPAASSSGTLNTETSQGPIQDEIGG